MKSPKMRLAMAGALVAMFVVGTPANVYGQATPPAKIAILAWIERAYSVEWRPEFHVEG